MQIKCDHLCKNNLQEKTSKELQTGIRRIYMLRYVLLKLKKVFLNKFYVSVLFFYYFNHFFAKQMEESSSLNSQYHSRLR